MREITLRQIEVIRAVMLRGTINGAAEHLGVSAPGIKLFTKIVEMPRSVLIPLILLLSIVGAYAVNNSLTDVYWMLGFGFFGYFMRHYGYPLGPVILGVILSRLLDDNWRRAIISEREDLGRFFYGIVTSPLSLVLFSAVILIFVSQTPLWAWGKARLRAGKSNA